jgi:hypothetical protein
LAAAGIKKPANICRGRNSKYQFRRITPINPIRQALFEKYFCRLEKTPFAEAGSLRADDMMRAWTMSPRR